MNIQSKINIGIVAEWISIIDPKMTQDLQFEEKIAAIIKSQTDLLLNSDMTEIRSKHWILTKRKDETGITIEFSLVAYSGKVIVSEENENDFHLSQLNRLQTKMKKAIEDENYPEAAKLRDMISSLREQSDNAA
jgi:excinuclease UvrABC helicase subunit UvrB